MNLQKGAKVTRQPRTWFDGQPVQGWPDPQFVGVVRKVETFRGLPMARIKWASGRTEWKSATDLIVIPS